MVDGDTGRADLGVISPGSTGDQCHGVSAGGSVGVTRRGPGCCRSITEVPQQFIDHSRGSALELNWQIVGSGSGRGRESGDGSRVADRDAALTDGDVGTAGTLCRQGDGIGARFRVNMGRRKSGRGRPVSEVPHQGVDGASRRTGKGHRQVVGPGSRRSRETGHRCRIGHGDARLTNGGIGSTGTRSSQGHSIDSSSGVGVNRIRATRSTAVTKIPRQGRDRTCGSTVKLHGQIPVTGSGRGIETCDRCRVCDIDATLTDFRIRSAGTAHRQ